MHASLDSVTQQPLQLSVMLSGVYSVWDSSCRRRERGRWRKLGLPQQTWQWWMWWFYRAISGLLCEKARGKSYQLMFCILTVHLNLSLRQQIAGKVNKRIAWLGLAACVFSLKAIWFLRVFLLLWRSPRTLRRRFWHSPIGGMIQWEFDENMKVFVSVHS